MSCLKPFLLALFVGCTSAGIVSKVISEKDAEKGGFKRAIGFAPEDILVLLGKGAFVLEMTPFKKGKDTLQKMAETRYYVRLYWRDTEMNNYNLDIIEIDWPEKSKPSIALVKPSIKPKGIDENLDLTVKYLKKNSCTVKTYFWDSSTNTYQPRAPVETQLAQCF